MHLRGLSPANRQKVLPVQLQPLRGTPGLRHAVYHGLNHLEGKTRHNEMASPIPAIVLG
jgi:hypothetical protein